MQTATAQYPLEVHPAFGAELTKLMQRIVTQLDNIAASPDDPQQRIASHLAAEVRAQMEADGVLHYFASSFTTWVASADLMDAIERCRNADKCRDGYSATGCEVYRVPGPPERPYHIDRYVQQVPGVTSVATVEYPAKKAKRTAKSK